MYNNNVTEESFQDAAHEAIKEVAHCFIHSKRLFTSELPVLDAQFDACHRVLYNTAHHCFDGKTAGRIMTRTKLLMASLMRQAELNVKPWP